MMGFLFTELIEMSEKRYGLQFIEEVLANAGLTNEGAFTTVGYYTRHDMELLLNSLAQGLGKSKSIVYQELGIHLTNTLIRRRPEFYSSIPDLFTFLKRFGTLVKTETAKLYPDAPCPLISANLINRHKLELLYQSPNRAGDLIEGCILGHADYYAEPISVTRTNLNPDGSKVLFLVERIDEND